ncbi:MAG: hypothetical protein PHF67_02795 [Candidatus Nanoarchaeia archaeon]|nr:hypothetical protein [Candidatus Nanoarchaeia archaeon]
MTGKTDGENELIRNKFLKRFEKQQACEEKGHPFPERIVSPYDGKGGDVLVRCSGCGALYDRMTNAEERQSYSNLLKLEFTV